MAFHDDADADNDLWRGGGGLGLSGGSSGAASVTRIRGCSSRGRYLPRWVRLGVSWTRWVRRSRWSRKARWSRWQNFCFLLSKQSAPNQNSCVSLLPPHHTFTALNMSLFIWPRRSKVRKVSKQSTSNAEINIKYNKYVIKKNFCEVKENSFHIRWKLMQIIKIHFTSSNAKMTGGTREVRSDKSLTFLTFDIWQWSYGPVVQWTNGPMDQWTQEIKDQWSNGPIV